MQLHDPHAHITSMSCLSTQRLIHSSRGVLKLLCDAQSVAGFDSVLLDCFIFVGSLTFNVMRALIACSLHGSWLDERSHASGKYRIKPSQKSRWASSRLRFSTLRKYRTLFGLSTSLTLVITQIGFASLRLSHSISWYVSLPYPTFHKI